MDELGLEEEEEEAEEEVDFLTYCSNVECQDDLYRTFIKLCDFLPAAPSRSELILPLSREEDLITLPDEVEPPPLPDEVDHYESFVSGQQEPVSVQVTVFPANRLVVNPTDSGLPTPTSVSSDRTIIQIPSTPIIPNQAIAPFLDTSDVAIPPLLPPARIPLIPPPIPERVLPPPLNRSTTTDTPLQPPAATRQPPKPARPATAPSRHPRKAGPSDPATSSSEPTPDTNLNNSGTLTRNLSKNIPDKSFTLKEKSLVKSVLQSQEPLFLPRSLFLRQTSCHDDETALPRLRGIFRTESYPGADNSYSMINLSDLPCDDTDSTFSVAQVICEALSSPTGSLSRCI